ncbi:MAG: hypothetical protein AAF993_07710 [Pseudomonadota bacterium]
MSTLKYEFCSAGWIDQARVFLEAAAQGQDLSKVQLIFSEVFTGAPVHLNPDSHGRIGWYMRIHKGDLEVAAGIPAAADFRITVDYQTILPVTRLVFEGNPEAMQEAGRIVSEAMADGRMTRDGDENEMAKVPWFIGLHDAMALQTA